ncbi:hypothetical protein TNCV_896061 [Trichonephila clavipes]|nr:hypothetical protein TNCV_896061 [Trichonephila clavipes]
MINAKKKERFLPDPGTIVLRQKDINLVTGKPFRIKTCCSSQMLINSLREDTEYLLDLGVNGMGQSNRTLPVVWLLEQIDVSRMVDTDILIQIWKNRVKKIDFVLKWLSRVGSEVGPTKVWCERDTRNNWRDGQVCPDVGQGTMAPWARRLGRERSRKRETGGERERRRKEKTRGDEKGERERKSGVRGENGWKEKEGRRKRREREGGEETRGEDRRDGERKGLSPGLEWKDDERRFGEKKSPRCRDDADESINAALIEEQNMKLNQIASEERSGLSSAQTENPVLSALADRLEEIHLRVGRLQEASSVTARKSGGNSFNRRKKHRDERAARYQPPRRNAASDYSVSRHPGFYGRRVHFRESAFRDNYAAPRHPVRGSHTTSGNRGFQRYNRNDALNFRGESRI